MTTNMPLDIEALQKVMDKMEDVTPEQYQAEMIRLSEECDRLFGPPEEVPFIKDQMARMCG